MTIILLLIAILQGSTSRHSANGLAYERAGSGPAVVFLHGAFLDRRMWDREFDALKDRATVVRYDQRGHGGTAWPSEPFSHVVDLLALLDELKIARATLVGLSSGAQISLDAALAAPHRVERLVLAGPAISGYVDKNLPPFAKDLTEALKAADYAKAADVILATPILAVPPESRAFVRAMVTGNESLWKADRRLMQAPERTALSRLEQIKVPTLVLVGDQDVEAIREQAGILRARVPTARVVTIADGGHLLNLTSPAEFARVLFDFIGT